MNPTDPSIRTPPINTTIDPQPVKKKCRWKSFFRHFLFWKKKSQYNFQAKDVRIIKAASSMVGQKADAPAASSPKVSVRNPAPKKPEPQAQTVKTPDPRKNFSPALNEMQHSVHELVEKIYLCASEEYQLTDKVQHLEHLTKALPTYLRIFAKLVVQTANKASIPLIQTLNNAQTPFHDAVQRNKDEITASLGKAFTWLVDPTNRNDTYQNQIHHLLTQRLSKLPIPKGQSLDYYLKPILDWTFKSDFSQIPHHLRSDFNPNTFNAVFEELGIILLDKKIDAFEQLIKTTFNNTSLTQIVEKMIHDNALQITDTLTERAAGLLQNLEYPKTYENYIHAIDSYLEAIATTKTLEDFAKTSACHPAVKKEIQTGNTQDETIHVSHLIDNIYKLLTSIDNEETAIATFWKQKIVPKELQHLIDEGEALFDQLLTPAAKENLDTAKLGSRSIFEHAVSQLVEKHIKKRIKTQVLKTLDDLENPTKFNELVAQKVFPNLNKKLLDSCLELTLDDETHLKAIANQIDLRMLASASPDENTLKLEIAQKLIEWTDNKLIEAGISQEKVNSSALEIANLLCSYLNKNKDTQLTTVEKIKKFLTRDNPKVYDEIYGNMVINLLCKIGKIDEKFLTNTLGQTLGQGLHGLAANTITEILKSKVVPQLRNALAPFTQSPDTLVALATTELNSKFKTSKDVKQVLFNNQPVQPKDPQQIQQQFDKQIELTSKIVHYILTENLRLASGGGLTGMLYKAVIPSTKEIEISMNQIFQECFGQPQKLKSLAFTISDLAVKALMDADKKPNSQ